MSHYYDMYMDIQSNEVGGSYHMEKEGLHRVMEFLKSELLTIDTIVTDRHRQINKWLRDNKFQGSRHILDLWAL